MFNNKSRYTIKPIMDDLGRVIGFKNLDAFTESLNENLIMLIRDSLRYLAKTTHDYPAWLHDEVIQEAHDANPGAENVEVLMDANQRWVDKLIKIADLFDCFLESSEKLSTEAKQRLLKGHYDAWLLAKETIDEASQE